MMKTWPPDEAQRCSSTASMALTGRTPSFNTLGFSQLHKPSEQQTQYGSLSTKMNKTLAFHKTHHEQNVENVYIQSEILQCDEI